MSNSGIVNVRMVITEEKILSNIDKVQRMINPKSKKQIVQLEEDTYFKDLVESVKTYLIEYPKKKNFPANVYKASYGLVEFATNQFEENTKKIEELIRQREENIALAGVLKQLIEDVTDVDQNWKEVIKDAKENFDEDIIEPLTIIARSKSDKTDEYKDAMKLLHARVNNLESNLHIEIDMERIEDKSKALSYIGIEIADALRSIPTPIMEMEQIIEEPQETVQTVSEKKVEKVQEKVAEKVKADKVEKIETVQKVERVENVEAKVESKEKAKVAEAEANYAQETTFEAKPSLWQRIKNSKIVKAIKAIKRIRIVVDYSDALPEGRGENK